MADYDNTNKGVIFKNDQKGNDKAPMYRGKGNFEGKNFEMALWVKKDKNNNSYFTVAFSEPYVRSEETTNNRVISNEDDNDDLPF